MANTTPPKLLTILNVGKAVEEPELSNIVGDGARRYPHLENCLAASQVKFTSVTQPSNFLCRHLPERNEINSVHKKTCKDIHNCFIYNSKKVKQPKCPSVEKWINEFWYIHANGTLFKSLKRKKEQTTDIFSNMDDSLT